MSYVYVRTSIMKNYKLGKVVFHSTLKSDQVLKASSKTFKLKSPVVIKRKILLNNFSQVSSLLKQGEEKMGIDLPS